MKTIYLLLLGVLCFVEGNSYAQTYSSWATADANGTAYDTIVQYEDTLDFTFMGMPLGGYGSARLMVYYEGDFGDPGEHLNVYDQTVTMLIGASTNTSLGDCAPEDSTLISFPGANLDAWQTAGSWTISLVPTNQVDFFCTTLRVRVRLEYDYCAAGTPVEFASILADTNFVCNHNSANFTVSPAGGTLSGPGVSGLTFNPAALSPGNYTFTYTGTDAIGCTTSASTIIKVGNSPGAQSYLVCEGGNSPVLGGPNAEFIYSYDVDHMMPIDTAVAYVYGPVTQSPDIIYTSRFSRTGTFTLDTVTNDNVVYIDHDMVTGDDRGGIALTDSTVYIVGDNMTARYDLDLLTAGVALPIRDGIFSDLSDRKIWTIYNTTTSALPNSFSGVYTVNAIAEMDADLALTGSNIPLSQSIDMEVGPNQSAILSGFGKLGLYNGDVLYVVDVSSGTVDSIGQYSFPLYGSEGFADWGNLGFDGVNYVAYYREWMNGQIVAHDLETDLYSPISQLPGSSDMASFSYHPGNNRLYFHYEGSGNYGGSSETLGYVDAEATIVLTPGGSPVGCPAEIEFTFNTLDLGADTSLCPGHIPYVIEPGIGYVSYTWNGVNNNWNVYPVVTAETVIAEVVDASNCILIDTITVTFDNCVGIDELNSDEFAIYPNPNNGKFSIQFGTSVEGVEVAIIDTKGRMCHNESFNGTIMNATIETEKLQKGMYIVAVTANGVTTQKSIVVQ